jgi:hypothetical protein
VSVACGGTVVYDDVAAALDGRFAVEPWTAGRVAGLVEFGDFAVAPGSRRGVLLDEAADAFARVVEGEIAPAVRALLAEDERRRAAAMEADLVQKLERAFRDLAREAPEYDFFAVRGPGEVAGTAALPVGAVAEGDVTSAEEAPVVALFPPGPLEHIEVVPARGRVERWGERRLRARATDAEGVRVGGVECVWAVVEGAGSIEASGGTGAVFRAGEATGTVRLVVTARKDGRERSAEAVVEVVEEIGAGGPRAGIPEPAFVMDPRGEWRSRVADGRWEVNATHRDFLSVEAAARRKLRYLAALLAKEIVLHSYPMPQGGMLLERLVAVMTVAERRLEKG